MQNMLSCSYVAMQLRNLAFNFVKSIGYAALMQIYDPNTWHGSAFMVICIAYKLNISYCHFKWIVI